jgi:hypothetical protein
MAAGSVVIDILMKTGSFITDAARAEKSVKSFRKSTIDLTGTLKSLAPALSIGAVVAFSKSLIDSGDALEKLSNRTGVAIKDLASLELIAKQSDTSIDALGASFAKLTRNIGEAEAGNTNIAKALKDLGVTSKDPVEGFLQLADAVEKNNDRTAIASQLSQVLGKSYLEVFNVLKNGRGAIEQAIKDSENYANAQAKFAPQAAAFKDQIDGLKQSLAQIGIALLTESGSLQALSDAAKFATENSYKLTQAIKVLTIALSAFVANKAVVALLGLSKGFGLVAASVTAVGVAFKQGMADTMQNSIGRIVDAQRALDELQPRLDRLKNISQQRELGFFENISLKNLTKNVKDEVDKIDRERNKLKKILGDMATPDIKKAQDDLDQINAAITKPSTTLPDNSGAAVALAAFIQKVNEAIQPNKDLTVVLQEQLDSFADLDPVMKQYLQNQVDIVKINQQGSDVIEKLTERQKRLKEILGQTEIGQANQQIKQAEKDVLILNEAFEAGEISLKEYLQAQDNLFGKTSENIKETQGFMRDLGATFSSAFEQAIIDGQKFSQVLAGLANDIQRLITRRFISDPLMKGIDSILGNVAGSLGLDTLFSAKGNAFDQSGVKAFATGGVVSGATPFTYGGGKLGVMGEAGPEAILPLSRINGDLGVKAQIATPVINVNIHEAAGTKTSVERSTDANGNMSIEVIVEQVESIMGRNIYRGSGLAPTIERRYGLNRAAGA